jgi:hypothetical protein
MPFEAVPERQAALVSGACRLSLREVDCSAQAIEATDTAALQRLALLFAPELKVASATFCDGGRSVRLEDANGRARPERPAHLQGGRSDPHDARRRRARVAHQRPEGRRGARRAERRALWHQPRQLGDGRDAHRACRGGGRGGMPRDAAAGCALMGREGNALRSVRLGGNGAWAADDGGDARVGAGRGVVRGGGARRERERPGRGRVPRARQRPVPLHPRPERHRRRRVGRVPRGSPSPAGCARWPCGGSAWAPLMAARRCRSYATPCLDNLAAPPLSDRQPAEC